METYLGTILPWPMNFPPKGWAMCNGAMMNIMTNQALFALLGTNYGGNGTTTFALPDLRGRVALGAGPNNPLAQVTTNKPSAATGQLVLQANNLPQHSHPSTVTLSAVNAQTTINVGTSQTAGALVPAANSTLGSSPPATENESAAIYLPSSVPAGTTVNLGGVSTTIAGTGILKVGANPPPTAAVTVNSTFQATPPYLGLNFIICISGIYPSRN